MSWFRKDWELSEAAAGSNIDVQSCFTNWEAPRRREPLTVLRKEMLGITQPGVEVSEDPRIWVQKHLSWGNLGS